MKFKDLIGLSFENLRRRFGRTSLTIIGVVIGTCSIVVMVSLGIAMNIGFEEMLASWSDLTKIQVYNWGGNGSDTPALDDKIISKIAKIENVTVATPEYRARYLQAQIKAGKSGRYVMEAYNIVGIYPQAIEALEYELKSGTTLPDIAPVASQGKGKILILAGENAGYEFRDTKKRGQNSMRYKEQTDANGNLLPPFVDVTKDKLTLFAPKQDEEKGKDLSYELGVNGVMVEDFKKGYVTSGGILMDLNVLKRLEKEYMKVNNIKVSSSMNTSSGYDNVTVKVNNVDNVKAVEDAIKAMGYSTDSASSQREQMQKQSQMIQMVLGGLGFVSLFVAALSIANTMTMAIYERTREIGVMKVLGCGLGKIRVMFLLEAAMIGFIGGVMGIVVSYTLSFLLNHFAPALMQMGLGNFIPMMGSKISVIPWWLALVGVGFSTAIGILSGIMPARRAVKISALEAIRHE